MDLVEIFQGAPIDLPDGLHVDPCFAPPAQGKALTRKTDRAGREYCYEGNAYHRVPCHGATPQQAPHGEGPAGGDQPAPQEGAAERPAAGGGWEAHRKSVKRFERLVDLGRRRRALHGLRNEKELADAIGAWNLPDSEPADIVFLADHGGEIISDAETVKHVLRLRQNVTTLLKRGNITAEQERKYRDYLDRHTVFFVEVKTLITSKSGRIQMSASALKAKHGWAAKYGARFVTAAFDDRKGAKYSGNRLYLRDGVGGFHVSDATPAKHFGDWLGKAGELLSAGGDAR